MNAFWGLLGLFALVVLLAAAGVPSGHVLIRRKPDGRKTAAPREGTEAK